MGCEMGLDCGGQTGITEETRAQGAHLSQVRQGILIDGSGESDLQHQGLQSSCGVPEGVHGAESDGDGGAASSTSGSVGNLILTRKPGETVRIVLQDGSHIDVTFVEFRSGKARIAFAGPKSTKVYRKEIWSKLMKGAKS